MKLFGLFKKSKSQRRLAIIDVNDASFRQQVIQRSHKTPVMVDYWAPWCGPCRQLGPVLEKLAENPDSEFILAKLNTENNRRTAARYNIRSIPAVKVFRNGQVVGEFTGARPEPLVRNFIQEITSASPPPPKIKRSRDPGKRLQQAEHHLKTGKGFEAFVLLQDFPLGSGSERAEKLLPLARFLVDVDDGDGLTGLDDLDGQYLTAAKALRQRKPAQALEHLFSALEVGEEIDRPVTTSVVNSLFVLLGEKSQVTERYRQKLASFDAGDS
jgi:putative thioredoxin